MTILASSRRRGRRAARRGRQAYAWTLPDWMWGMVLGVLVLGVVGGFFLVSGVLGGGGGPCDKPLTPLETSDISEAGFREEDAGLANVIQLLNQGDITGAETAFYGPVHNFTHNVDPSIRAKDEKLAKQLCAAVIDIEEALVSPASPQELALKAQTIRDLLREGAAALGYAPP